MQRRDGEVSQSSAAGITGLTRSVREAEEIYEYDS